MKQSSTDSPASEVSAGGISGSASNEVSSGSSESPALVLNNADGPSRAPLLSAPLTLGGILDTAFNICRAHLGTLFLLVVTPWVLMQTCVLLTAALLGDLKVIVQPLIPGVWAAASLYQLDMGFPMWGLIVTAVISALVSMFTFGALTYGLGRLCTGHEISIGECYRGVLRRFVMLFLAYLFIFAAVFLSIMLAVLLGVVFFFALQMFDIPGWWSAAAWPLLALGPALLIPKVALVDEAVIIEGKNCFSAIARSWSLLKGKAVGPWPRSFYIRYIILMHVYLGITLIVTFVFTPVSQLMTYAAPESLRPVAAITGMFLSYFGGTVAGLIIAASEVVFFFDVRNRKEGLDLALMADR
jgi:hypothetical protein